MPRIREDTDAGVRLVVADRLRRLARECWWDGQTACPPGRADAFGYGWTFGGILGIAYGVYV